MFAKLIPTKEWLVYDDNPLMQQKCVDLTFPLNKDDSLAIAKMISYIDASYHQLAAKYKIQAGIGIAANQIGYNKRVFYVHFNENQQEHHYLLANPIIHKQSVNKMYLKNGEGCLSVSKAHSGFVVRKQFVHVSAIDVYTQKKVQIQATGLLGVCFQHEVDHLNNLFYYNRINPIHPFYKENS